MSDLRSFLILSVMFISAAGNSQPRRTIDSLIRSFPSTSHDTLKAAHYQSLAYAYSFMSPDSSLRYAMLALAHSRAASWSRGEAAARVQAGLSQAALYRYRAADSSYRAALSLYKDLADTGGMASVLANRSLLLKVQGDFAGALHDAFSALSYLEELNDTTRRAVVLENIGTIYLRQKKYDKTIQYYGQALDLYKAAGNKSGFARNLGNTGIVHNEKGDYRSALRSHSLALQINRELGNLHSVQINYANLGITYTNLKEYPAAIQNHLKALEISKQLKDRSSVAINLGNAGEVYYLMAKEEGGTTEHIRQAVQYLREAVKICSEIAFVGPYIEFARYLSDALMLAGEHKEALEVYKEFTAAEDSIYSEESRLKIAEAEARREQDLRNRDMKLNEQKIEIENLQLINKRNERWFFICCIVFLLVLLVLLYRLYRLRTLRHKRTLSDIAHIQSHEVRAPLARILGLVSLIENEKLPADKERMYEFLKKSAEDLDAVIRKTVKTTAS